MVFNRQRSTVSIHGIDIAFGSSANIVFNNLPCSRCNLIHKVIDN